MRISDWSSGVCSSDLSRLPVYFERRVVGWIEADVDGPGFRYDAGWLTTSGAFPVSTAMPLGPARIPWSVFLTWASNLLPENEQLQIVGRYLGAASSDVIGILSAIGRDTAGALRSEEHTSELQSLMRISYAVFCLKKTKSE